MLDRCAESQNGGRPGSTKPPKGGWSAGTKRPEGGRPGARVSSPVFGPRSRIRQSRASSPVSSARPFGTPAQGYQPLLAKLAKLRRRVGEVVHQAGLIWNSRASATRYPQSARQPSSRTAPGGSPAGARGAGLRPASGCGWRRPTRRRPATRSATRRQRTVVAFRPQAIRSRCTTRSRSRRCAPSRSARRDVRAPQTHKTCRTCQ